MAKSFFLSLKFSLSVLSSLGSLCPLLFSKFVPPIDAKRFPANDLHQTIVSWISAKFRSGINSSLMHSQRQKKKQKVKLSTKQNSESLLIYAPDKIQSIMEEIY